MNLLFRRNKYQSGLQLAGEGWGGGGGTFTQAQWDDLICCPSLQTCPGRPFDSGRSAVAWSNITTRHLQSSSGSSRRTDPGCSHGTRAWHRTTWDEITPPAMQPARHAAHFPVWPDWFLLLRYGGEKKQKEERKKEKQAALLGSKERHKIYIFF